MLLYKLRSEKQVDVCSAGDAVAGSGDKTLPLVCSLLIKKYE